MTLKNKYLVLNIIYSTISILSIFIGYIINELPLISWGMGSLVISLGNLVIVLCEKNDE